MSEAYLLRASLRNLLRIKSVIGIGLLILLGPAIAALWRVDAGARFKPDDVYNSLMQGMVFGFMLLILSVVFSTSAISQEVEAKTIVYLLTRPVPRWRILLVKFCAVTMVVLGAVWLSTLLIALISFGPAHMGHSQLARDLEILPIAVLAYGGLFLLLGVSINRALLWGLGLAFGWESWVPSLPGSFSRVSIMTYLRALAPHAEAASEAGLLPGSEVISHATAWKVLLILIVVTLGPALALFSTREYVPRDEAA